MCTIIYTKFRYFEQISNIISEIPLFLSFFKNIYDIFVKIKL